MALVLLATLLGLFGDGILSRAQSGSLQTFSVSYDRLLRSSAPAQYRFRVNPAALDGDSLRLRISQSLVDRMEVESIVPQPTRQIAGPGYTEFVFAVMAGHRIAQVDFRYRPATFGRQRGTASIAGAHPLAIDQFVYP